MEDAPKDDLVEPVDLIQLFTIDSTSLDELLLEEEDGDPPQNPTANSSPPPLLHTDRVQQTLHNKVETRLVSSKGNRGAHRRIWGVSSNCYNRILKSPREKMSSMDEKSDWQKVSCLSYTHSGTATLTSELAGCADNHLATNLQVSGYGVEEGSEMNVAGRSKRKDAPRNLLAERQRRRQLNERLFSLRALVPNISKELEGQVEATHKALANSLAFQHRASQHHHHQVVKFAMTQMEDNVYELQMHCKKSMGMWLHLAQAIEALKCVTISASFSYIKDHMLNSLIIEVPKEYIQSNEETSQRTMEVMSRSK